MFDKHIPIPKHCNKHPNFKAMEVGDSVFVPHEGTTVTCPAYVYAATIQRRSDIYRFMGRSVYHDGVPGIRIWRTR